MTPTPEVQERLRRYLLGQLADHARTEVEAELLASGETFEELLVVEDELIDDYLAAELSVEDRHRFEHYFLSTPARHEKLNFARALNRYVAASEKRPAAAGRFLPGFITRQTFLVRTASIVLVLAAVTGLIWMLRSQRSTPQTFLALSVNLSQGTRAEGPEVPTVKLPIAEDALKIIMRLPDQVGPASTLRAELEGPSGGKQTLEPVARDPRSLTVVIPSDRLSRGQYSIKVFVLDNGGNEQRVNGSYLFTLE